MTDPEQSRKLHWENVYTSTPTERLGWYKPRLDTSMEWILALGLQPGQPIIEVGCGASPLVEGLLDAGHVSITAIDISANALELVQERLGERASDVTWLCDDITKAKLPADAYELWHDRAVFHFLTEPDQQSAYKERLLHALRPGGSLIIGVFSPDAPPRCSGLPVQRYDEDLMSKTLGDSFELKQSRRELHLTPGGVEQMYLYCRFQKAENQTKL